MGSMYYDSSYLKEGGSQDSIPVLGMIVAHTVMYMSSGGGGSFLFEAKRGPM